MVRESPDVIMEEGEILDGEEEGEILDVGEDAASVLSVDEDEEEIKYLQPFPTCLQCCGSKPFCTG